VPGLFVQQACVPFDEITDEGRTGFLREEGSQNQFKEQNTGTPLPLWVGERPNRKYGTLQDQKHQILGKPL
jgi:hypothetical protein